MELARSVERRMTVALLLAHTIGAIDVALLITTVLPQPEHAEGSVHVMSNVVAGAVYFPLAIVVAVWLGRRGSPTRQAWIVEGRAPTDEERAAVLRTPLQCVVMDGGFWLGGLILFAAVNVSASPDMAFHVASTILMGGLTVSALAYLLAERIMRPITALALADAPPIQPKGPGVKGRLVLVWLLATGIPVLGLAMVAVHSLTQGDVSADQLAVAVLVLSVGGFAVGLVGTALVAKSVADPVKAVRRALARVESGDLAAEVPVDDGSEVGLLQSGFNRMASGLRERERLRDLLGRHVGEDVAAAAIADEPELGGSVREVAVLFVDLVGSTALASREKPERVVAMLNRFFAVVVDTVETHGGWVNKFEGDAALCVFGAPAEIADPAGCALAAARELSERLPGELPELEAGIGVSAGPAVAGWVGAESRFEYTVIGDPVNEAARLCELARRDGPRLIASEAVVERAARGEAGRWRFGRRTVLRGRSAETRLAVPAATVEAT